MIRCWRLDDGFQTIALGARNDRLPEVVYWGPRLPDEENLEILLAAHAIDITGGMLDETPELSICPEATQTFPGQPGLILRDIDGAPLSPKFRFTREETSDDALSLIYTDDANALTYAVRFTTNAHTRVIVASAALEAVRPVYLLWLAAPVLPAPQLSDEMIDFAGRWCGEFQLVRTPWSPGMRCRENRTGRTGHEHFPGLIAPCRGATNTGGQAYAFHYGWSGGHKMIAEELPDGRRQIQFGNATGAELEACTHFETAPLYVTFSDDGLNGCGVAFQRHLRDEIVKLPNPDRPRPVHYNCWEAIYFDHKLPALEEAAERAARLGAERFVLDDGWFGQRDNDTRSLSDWEVDPRKYPEGLNPLISHVHALGMTFGIWFEPEMINPDSNLYRSHPEWALGPEDQILGRHQKALDMSLPEVRENLRRRLSEILQEYDIDYIKWDHNRVLPAPDAAQTRGSYDLIDRLRTDFPHVEFESCASGGGRIDFGILNRNHRVWLSDSNDALERLKIQHNAALFLPGVATGSHVGPRKCHTSGRVHDIEFRAWVAAQRHMGFELDLRELDAREFEVLKRVTDWWKENRSWMMRADILRLDSPDPAVIAEQQLAEDGARFIAFIGKAETSAQIAPRPLRLTRLDPGARYRVELLNRADAPRLSRGAQVLKGQPIETSGVYLMNQGLTLPWSFPDNIWVVEGRRLA